MWLLIKLHAVENNLKLVKVSLKYNHTIKTDYFQIRIWQYQNNSNYCQRKINEHRIKFSQYRCKII